MIRRWVGISRVVVVLAGSRSTSSRITVVDDDADDRAGVGGIRSLRRQTPASDHEVLAEAEAQVDVADQGVSTATRGA